MREKGVVSAFIEDRGFGFIKRQGTSNVFFHITAIRNRTPETVIQRGAAVEFDVEQTEKGLAAMDVELV